MGEYNISKLDINISNAMHRIERLYYDTDGMCYLSLHTYEPNHYKAAVYFLKDIYIAQGVELPFDSDYMKEYKEKWIEYENMRYEMLKKYNPDCRICIKYERSKENSIEKR